MQWWRLACQTVFCIVILAFLVVFVVFVVFVCLVVFCCCCGCWLLAVGGWWLLVGCCCSLMLFLLLLWFVGGGWWLGRFSCPASPGMVSCLTLGLWNIPWPKRMHFGPICIAPRSGRRARVMGGLHTFVSLWSLSFLQFLHFSCCWFVGLLVCWLVGWLLLLTPWTD